MSRVVIGPYQSGIRLCELFKEAAIGENRAPVAADYYQTVDVEAFGNTVMLTSDWAERQHEWSPDYRGIIVTENDVKHWENDFPLSHTVFALEPKKAFIAGPDSIEAEATPIEIARGKAILGLLDPVTDATPQELRAALDAIDAKDAKHVVVLSEDRELIAPKCLKDASVWDDVRDIPLVRECFEKDEAFPGKRVNELQNACGGAVNFLLRLEKARAEMREKGHDVPDTHKSHVSYYMKFLEYDPSQPFPEEGIFVSASEHNRRFLPVTEAHIALEKAGAQLELDNFDAPSQYHDAYNLDGTPVTIESLKADPINGRQYFRREFSAARAMRAFAEVMGIPRRETPRTYDLVDMPGATMISNLNFGEFGEEADGLEDIGGTYRRYSGRHRIESHADLELPFNGAEGTIVEDWPVSAPSGIDQTLYELERKMVARMVIIQRATLKPLAEPSALGRPLMIDYGVRDREMGPYNNSVKFKATTSRGDHVYTVFSDPDGFDAAMQRGQWDAEHMKPLPETRSYDLSDENQFMNFMGAHDPMFTEALLSSASSHLEAATEVPRSYCYESGKKRMVMTDGGGSRSGMGAQLDGAIEALEEGYKDFLMLLCRVPVASRKEGSLKPFCREHGLEPEHGNFDEKYMAFGKGRFHSMTFDHMGERQHAIIGPAHVVTAFIGGVGTEYEYNMAMYHNLMVEMRGYGIFPGYENDKKKRIHFINSQVVNGDHTEHRYYDALKESFTEEEREILGMHFYDTPEEALEARNAHARALGFDIDVANSASAEARPTPL